jgi:hypothetical protein
VRWLRGSIIFCAIKFQPRIYLVYSQVKRHENVSFQIYLFLKLFFQYFSNNWPLIFFNWIWIPFNWILIPLIVKLNWIEMKFSSRCMQCDSIFSFKKKLISTKSIHFFSNWMVDRHWQCAAAGSPSNVYKNTNLLIFK